MTNFVSPVGRLVQGSAFEANAVIDTTTKQPKLTLDGKPRMEYMIGVAYAKNDPHWPAFEKIIKDVAAASFPGFFPQGPNGPCTHPNFSMKIVDGDGFDANGVDNKTKEGFAGHWVVRFKTGYPPTVYPANKYTPADLITDKNLLRTGYFVAVMGSVAGNKGGQGGGASRPGVYVNMSSVILCGFGPEIIKGPDVAAAMAGANLALPAGASPTPLGIGNGAPSAAPIAATPAAAAPAPIASPTSGPAPAPYTNYMGAPAPAAPVPAAPPARQMTPKANGATYEQFVANGWTDDALRRDGYML